MAEHTDVQHLVKQLMDGASPEENKALLDALMSRQVSSIFAEGWGSQVSDLLFALGWGSGNDRFSPPPANSATLDVLNHLAGAARVRWSEITGVDLAVAATARAVVRSG